jgi:hypothetical protein
VVQTGASQRGRVAAWHGRIGIRISIEGIMLEPMVYGWGALHVIVEWSWGRSSLEGCGLIRVDDFWAFVVAVEGYHGTHFLDMLSCCSVERVSSTAQTLAVFSTTAVMTRITTWRCLHGVS